MREIKFRAYHKERKEIFEIASIDFEEKKAALMNGIIKLLNVDFKQFELLQYTGLKDENSKEIYEGDILLSVNENGVFLQEIGFGGDEREYTEFLDGFKIVNGYALEYDVTFSELKEFTKNIVLKNNIPYENDGIDDFLYDGWWVIGNIYENKNLLEENNWLNTLKFTKSKLKMKIRYVAKIYINREEIKDDNFSSLTFEETAKHVLEDCVISSYVDMAEMEG